MKTLSNSSPRAAGPPTARRRLPGAALAVAATVLCLAAGTASAAVLASLHNPVADGTITIDGNMGDWAGLGAWPVDPQDAEPDVDWRQNSIAHDSTYFYVRHYLYDPVNYPLNAGDYNVFLDTDMNRSTGFRGGADSFSVGADYLFQGATVFQYAGDGTSWSWNYLNAYTWAIDGSGYMVESQFLKADIGDPAAFHLIYHGDNTTIIDYYPNTANGSPGADMFQYNQESIPEPASVAMLLLGVGVIAYGRRRRRMS